MRNKFWTFFLSQVVSLDTGEALGPHEQGEVCTKGSQSMLGKLVKHFIVKTCFVYAKIFKFYKIVIILAVATRQTFHVIIIFLNILLWMFLLNNRLLQERRSNKWNDRFRRMGSFGWSGVLRWRSWFLCDWSS